MGIHDKMCTFMVIVVSLSKGDGSEQVLKSGSRTA